MTKSRHGQSDRVTRRYEIDSNGPPTHGKDSQGGQMGKFTVKSSGERSRTVGHDDPRGPREEWRRGKQ